MLSRPSNINYIRKVFTCQLNSPTGGVLAPRGQNKNPDALHQDLLFARYPFAVPDIFLGDGAPSSAIDRCTIKFFTASATGGVKNFIPIRQSFSNTKQICLVFCGNIQIFSLKSPYSFTLFNFLVSK